MPAIEVAHLIADIGDDGVALGFDLDALRGLVTPAPLPIVPVGARSKLGPAFISHMVEVENGDVALAVPGGR